MPRSIYYIPNGPSNLRNIFTVVPWSQVAEYYLEIFNDAAVPMATTPKTKVAACEDDIRIHFINYLGTVDSISTQLLEKEHDAKSGSFEKSTTSPLVRSTHSLSRLNVRSNDNYKVSLIVDEKDLDWFDELMDSPLAWIEWPGTKTQAADYLPIVISDRKSVKFKSEDRFFYEVIVEFKMSHERFTLRN